MKTRKPKLPRRVRVARHPKIKSSPYRTLVAEFGVWGVTSTLEPKKFAVTHLPSGMALPMTSASQRKVTLLARELGAKWPNWRRNWTLTENPTAAKRRQRPNGVGTKEVAEIRDIWEAEHAPW